jgi:hypothetical protein
MTVVDEELLDRVSDRYDPELIVEVLGLSSKDILIAFYDDFIEQQEKFDEQVEDSQTDEEA